MIPKDAMTARSRRRRIIRKRRVIFERLLAVTATTLVLGLLPQLRFMLLLFLVAVAGIGVYVARLMQWKRDDEAAVRSGVNRPAYDPEDHDDEDGTYEYEAV